VKGVELQGGPQMIQLRCGCALRTLCLQQQSGQAASKAWLHKGCRAGTVRQQR